MVFLFPVTLTQFSKLEQQKSVIMADVGDTVTLHCFYQKISVWFITWHKQHIGNKPEMLASRTKLADNATLSDTFKNDPRFLVVTGEKVNHLMISNVQLSDSAMYFCGIAKYYDIQFQEGIMLIVKGSSSSIQTIVQEPPEKSVQPGDSVTLNCTVHTEPCVGEHSVYWFRQSEKSQPVFFYTHDQRCEIANTTQGNFYNFSVKNLKLNDAGTYYCAVASCGAILYGNGTRLNVNDTAGNNIINTQSYSQHLHKLLSVKIYHNI